VWRVRDGSVVLVRVYRDRADALAAVGRSGS
jgi:ketosteroid isomerase-like protein